MLAIHILTLEGGSGVSSNVARTFLCKKGYSFVALPTFHFLPPTGKPYYQTELKVQKGATEKGLQRGVTQGRKQCAKRSSRNECSPLPCSTAPHTHALFSFMMTLRTFVKTIGKLWSPVTPRMCLEGAIGIAVLDIGDVGGEFQAMSLTERQACKVA